MKDFIIPFKGLRLGEHEYDWDLTIKFFEENENPDILDCDLQVKIKLNKKERMLELNFRITGELEVACDRCLAPMKWPVDIDENFYFKFGTEREEESEVVMIIPETEYQIDVTPLIYDYVSLAIPMKKAHEEDANGNTGCDAGMLRKIQEHQQSGSTDPRWEALKNVKLENNN